MDFSFFFTISNTNSLNELKLLTVAAESFRLFHSRIHHEFSKNEQTNLVNPRDLLLTFDISFEVSHKKKSKGENNSCQQ